MIDGIKKFLEYLSGNKENSKELENFFERVSVFMIFLIMLYKFFDWFYSR